MHTQHFHTLWLFISFILLCIVPYDSRLKAQEYPTVSWKDIVSGVPTYSARDSIIVSEWLGQGIRQKEQQKDSALFWFHKAYDYSHYTGYHFGAIWSLFYIGAMHLKKGRTDSALFIYNLALERCILAPYSEVAPHARLMGNIGNIYYLQGDYRKASAYYDSSLKLSRKLKDNSAATTLTNLGLIYLRLDQPDKALNYFKEAETICRLRSDTNQLILSLNNKGEIYLALDSLKEAEAAYREQFTLARKVNSKLGLVLGYAGLGTLALQQNKPEEALVQLKEAASRMDDNNPYHSYTGIRSKMANTYFRLKQYSPAEQQLKIALKDAQNRDIKDELPAIHKTLVDIYKATGRYREALMHQQQYEQLKDSQVSREKAKDINELEIKYRSAEQARQLLLKQARLNEQDARLREHNFWIWTIALGALLMTALFVALYRNIIHRQNAALKNEKMKHLHATIEGEEKERRRIARELHDGIGGMLAAINMNIRIIKKERPHASILKVEQMVKETSLEVRKTAHNLMPNILEKHGLKEALLLHFEKISEGTGIQLELQYDEGLPSLDKSIELMLYRIFQELVQNIVKHAQATHAGIYIILRDGKLSITIEDNGIGFDTTQIQGGLGLDNIRYRVNIIKGEIHILSAKGRGSTIHMEFNFEDLVMNNE